MALAGRPGRAAVPRTAPRWRPLLALPALTRFERRPRPEPRPRCPPLAPKLETYEEELQQKLETLQEALKGVMEQEIQLVPPPELLHYRHRVRFELRHTAKSVDFVVFNPETKDWLTVLAYPIASERINRLMRDLREALAQLPRLSWKAFQVELLSNTKGQALALIMYHRLGLMA